MLCQPFRQARAGPLVDPHEAHAGGHEHALRVAPRLLERISGGVAPGAVGQNSHRLERTLRGLLEHMQIRPARLAPSKRDPDLDQQGVERLADPVVEVPGESVAAGELEGLVRLDRL